MPGSVSPICHGLGVLTLGPAALATATPPAVARAVQLVLEDAARHALATLPQPDRPAHLTATVDELRFTGLLATHGNPTTPPAVTPPTTTTRTAQAEQT